MCTLCNSVTTLHIKYPLVKCILINIIIFNVTPTQMHICCTTALVLIDVLKIIVITKIHTLQSPFPYCIVIKGEFTMWECGVQSLVELFQSGLGGKMEMVNQKW